MTNRKESEMTIEELRRQTEIQQAWLDGKQQIQMRNKANGWQWIDVPPAASTTEMCFCWDEYDYRIKPKPMVVYVPEDRAGAVLGNTAYSSVKPIPGGVRRWLRFVEDIDFDGTVRVEVAE